MCNKRIEGSVPLHFRPPSKCVQHSDWPLRQMSEVFLWSAPAEKCFAEKFFKSGKAMVLRGRKNSSVCCTFKGSWNVSHFAPLLQLHCFGWEQKLGMSSSIHLKVYDIFHWYVQSCDKVKSCNWAYFWMIFCNRLFWVREKLLQFRVAVFQLYSRARCKTLKAYWRSRCSCFC